MQRTMLSGKIHRATVTQSNLHYVGSVTIDEHLMSAANIVEGERIDIVDITNGARLTTYAITGTPGSGVIGINGAAAHLVDPGDLVILMVFQQLDECELSAHSPKVVHVDAANRIVALGTDPSQPVPGSPDQVPGTPAQPTPR